MVQGPPELPMGVALKNYNGFASHFTQFFNLCSLHCAPCRLQGACGGNCQLANKVFVKKIIAMQKFAKHLTYFLIGTQTKKILSDFSADSF